MKVKLRSETWMGNYKDSLISQSFFLKSQFKKLKLIKRGRNEEISSEKGRRGLEGLGVRFCLFVLFSSRKRSGTPECNGRASAGLGNQRTNRNARGMRNEKLYRRGPTNLNSFAPSQLNGSQKQKTALPWHI